MRRSFLLISTCLSIILSGPGMASMLSEPYASPALNHPSSSKANSLSFDTPIEVLLPEGSMIISVGDMLKLDESAARGNFIAQHKLGAMYKFTWKSYGTIQYPNWGKAVEYYTKAAVQGFAPALNDLGAMYQGGWPRADGSMQAPDSEKAVEYYTKADVQGFTQAQYNLGIMYQYGWQGADGSRKTPDPKKAVEYYTKAAVKGFAQAQYNLWDLLNQHICRRADGITQTSWIERTYSLVFKVPEGLHKQTVEDIYREFLSYWKDSKELKLFQNSPLGRSFDKSLCIALKDFMSLVNFLNESEFFVPSNQHLTLLIKMQTHPEINFCLQDFNFLSTENLINKEEEREEKYIEIKNKLLNISNAFKGLSDRFLYPQKLSHEVK